MSLQKVTVDLTSESSVPLFELGEIHFDRKGACYQYMQANGAKVANTLYSYHTNTGTGSTSYQVEDIADATVTPADAECVPVCCPQIAMTDNYYAWVFVGPGDFTGTSAAAIAVDTKLYLSTTAGAIDDAATAGLLRGVTTPILDDGTGTHPFHAAHRMYAEDLP